MFRNSTQKEHWTFTPAKLAALRHAANEEAVQRIRAGAGPCSGSPLTDRECLLLIANACDRIEILCRKMKRSRESTSAIPRVVAVTAALFLRRFYISHSVMEYDPNIMMLAAILLASKVEESHMSPTHLMNQVHELTRPKATANDGESATPTAPQPQRLAVKYTDRHLRSAEIVLATGLRFEFLVHHAHRCLPALLPSDSPADFTENARRTIEEWCISTDAQLLYQPAVIAACALVDEEEDEATPSSVRNTESYPKILSIRDDLDTLLNSEDARPNRAIVKEIRDKLLEFHNDETDVTSVVYERLENQRRIREEQEREEKLRQRAMREETDEGDLLRGPPEKKSKLIDEDEDEDDDDDFLKRA